MPRRESNRAQRAAPPPPSTLASEDLSRLSAEAGPIQHVSLIRRSPSQFPACLFDEKFGLIKSLLSLDLSHNNIRDLPARIGCLSSITYLNVSRNWLREFPVQIGNLSCLMKLDAHANELRPRTLPALAPLYKLVSLDLRFNNKIGESSATLLAASMPHVKTIQISLKVAHDQKLHAADRDATLLRSQLQPHCTPTLRRSLALVFGEYTNPDQVERDEVMDRLLVHHKRAGPRAVRHVKGVPLSSDVCEELLGVLEAWAKADEERKLPRERLTIRAQHYCILTSHLAFDRRDTKKAIKAARKLEQNSEMWNLALKALREVDPEFAQKVTAIAFTKNFVGSAHIDTQNIGPFYGLALGDFCEGGGALCVECSSREVAHVDTRNCLGKVDGRFPHCKVIRRQRKSYGTYNFLSLCL